MRKCSAMRFRNLLLLYVFILFVGVILIIHHTTRRDEFLSHFAHKTKRLNILDVGRKQRNSRLTSNGSEGKTPHATQTECFTELQSVFVPVDVYLVDVDVLNNLKRNCNAIPDHPVHVLMDIKHEKENFDKQYPEFNITYFEEHSDYRILKTKPRRVLLKYNKYKIGSIHMPVDIDHFVQLWKRSPFVNCLNLTVEREAQERVIPLQFVDRLAELRDHLLEFRAYPFLMGGSLLGWYRECSFIPHTHDTDFGIMSDEFSYELEDRLHHMDGMEVKKRMGRRNDSYEFTLRGSVPDSEKYVSMDIFVLYHDHSHGTMFMAGLNNNGTRYRWIFPRFDTFCTTILLDRAFFVPCNPLLVIEADHGETWREDWPTSRFGWASSNKNIIEYGNFTKKELEKYLIFY